MDFVTPFIEWLLKSEYIKGNKLFLNAVQAQDNNIQIVTQQISKNEDKEYVDGSVLHRVRFHILNYKSVSFDRLMTGAPASNENIATLLEVSKIIDFVQNMEAQRNYPDFGEKYEVQSICCEYNNPSSPAFQSGTSPALAKFTIPIICEVLELAD